eukprot:COSAG02_NODE_2055_length_9982_cov_3.771426_5_plen_77_part_00
MLASDTAEEVDEPYVEKAVLRELHPMLLNKQWVMDYSDAFEREDAAQTAEKNSVAEHIDFLARNVDPDTDSPYLRM